MEKIRKSSCIGKAAAVSLVCAVMLTAAPSFAAPDVAPSGPAGVNGGFGFTHGQIPVMEAGANLKHDSDIMRYDRNQKLEDRDFSKYQEERYGTGGSPVTNSAPQTVPDAMKATIDEIGTKGVYINSIEVSPSEILTKEEINGVIGQYVGKNVFMSDIQNAINAINNLYADSKGISS